MILHHSIRHLRQQQNNRMKNRDKQTHFKMTVEIITLPKQQAYAPGPSQIDWIN